MSEIAESDVCYCGHVRDEHEDGRHECTSSGCDCELFDHDELGDDRL